MRRAHRPIQKGVRREITCGGNHTLAKGGREAGTPVGVGRTYPPQVGRWLGVSFTSIGRRHTYHEDPKVTFFFF